MNQANAFLLPGFSRRVLAGIVVLCGVSCWASAQDTIVTANRVPLKSMVSPNGFVHPGISCDAETLSVMRDKVLAGVSPWVDYFEGLRRTPYAQLDRKPRFVEQITNDGGIYAFANDAQTAWTQTILYVVTGDEAYRKRPLEIIRWYAGRTDKSFFPHGFADSHIKIGKYVYTLCSAVDILRTIPPKDKSLAVTQDMVDGLLANCIAPIRKNSIERNDYFMNQHSYAIMGFLAATILGDNVADYQRAVEWTTVNASSPNQGRNGSIKEQIRLVTRNDKTGQSVEPNLQLVEMGRDQPHANGNLDNLLMMSKTIDFQGTRIDPAQGTVTQASSGVSPIHFLDDRLLHGLLLSVKYNLGYGLRWVPTYSETSPTNTAIFNQISYFGRGMSGSNGLEAGYYYYKGLGYDLNRQPYAVLKAAFDASQATRERTIRSGVFINQLHNYAFDFWIGLPASASDAKPDAEKAQRALAKVLPPLEVNRNGQPVEGDQFENSYFDLSAHAAPGDIYPGSPKDIPLTVERDSDGTGYVRMTLTDQPRTMVTYLNVAEHAGIRMRSDKLVQIKFYPSNDYAKRPSLQTAYLPDTHGAWTHVATQFSAKGILYIQVTSLAGPAKVDFDRIDPEADAGTPVAFANVDPHTVTPAYVGEPISKAFVANGQNVAYSAINLPAGAALDKASGTLAWTPGADQTGDHALYVVAKAGDAICALPTTIHVEKDLQSALNYAAESYDPQKKYESASLAAFKAALASRDLNAVAQAAGALKLLTPRLADGTLDYTKTWSSTIKGSANMADGDPLTWGGEWGFDKNVTMDFGRPFKVKCRSFTLQARDGFPIRVAQAVVYGSNNGFDWTLLTENAAEALADPQTLKVKPALQQTPFRFLRFFMPAKSYGIFEISELRIDGDRVEDYSPDIHRAYITGFDDNTFRPDQPITRATAVTSLAKVTDDYTDKGAYACRYSDITAKVPYYDDLAYLTSKGVLSADHGKAFAPDAPLTRGQLATALSRINKLAGRRDVKLADVSPSTPNAAEIGYVVQKGWLQADANGRFRPNDPVTRAQFVMAINQMLNRDDPVAKGATPFTDVPPASPAYRAIMEATHTHEVR